MSAQQELDLEALLDGIWQRRRAELRERVDLLAGLLERAVQDGAAWQELGAQAHRLTGALGSLGFDVLAQAARRLETAVAAAPAPPADIASLRAEAAALQAGVTAATRPRG